MDVTAHRRAELAAALAGNPGAVIDDLARAHGVFPLDVATAMSKAKAVSVDGSAVAPIFMRSRQRRCLSALETGTSFLRVLLGNGLLAVSVR